MTFTNRSMFTRWSRRRDGKDRAARRGVQSRRQRRFEQLEDRVLLSISDPVKDAAIQRLGTAQIIDEGTMLWTGQEVDYVVDEWIAHLNYDQSLSVQEQLNQASSFFTTQLPGTTVDQHLGLTGMVSITTTGASLQQMALLLQNNDEIQYVEPSLIVHAKQTIPNDSRFSELWGLNNTGQTGGTPDADIDAVEAWDIGTGDPDIVVGIIDSGMDLQHPDLVANLWVNPGEIAGDGIDNDGNGFIDDVNGWDFVNNDADPTDDNGHGTHVAGTVGAVGNNSIGVAGVNWDVQLMALKFLDAAGFGSTADAIASINYATTMRRDFGIDIRVTNNSWGGPGFSQAVLDAIIANNATGMLFVAAAGNAAADNDAVFDTPSGYDVPNVVAVAATDDNDIIANFSNFGATSVDLGAPGVGILSTVPTTGLISDPSGYLAIDGTSQASPHVAGAAALIWSIAPSATHIEVRDAILDNVDPLASLQGITVTGGRLNLFRAAQALEPEDQDQQAANEPPVVVDVELRDLDVIVTFSEPVTFVTTDTFLFQGAGSDGIFDTQDDVNYAALAPTPATRSQTFAFAQRPRGMAIGPDGNLYVSNADADSVLRYDISTGQFLSEFVAPGVGGLDNPGDLVFGPQGKLYVVSSGTQSILQYDGVTGDFIGEFIAAGTGGLDVPRGVAFGPDDNLYVTSGTSSAVLRYDGQSGALINAFVTSGSGGLSNPSDLIFGPDDNLYVSSEASGAVIRYDGMTGAPMGVFASGGGLTSPRGLSFGPDGNLYVGSFTQNKVLRFEGATGTFLDDFAGGGSISGPDGLVFRPDGNLLLASSQSNEVVQFDANAWTFSIEPSQSVPNGIYRVILKGTGAVPYAFTKLAGSTDATVAGVLDTAINDQGTIATLVNLDAGGQAILLHTADGPSTLIDTNTSSVASMTAIALNNSDVVAFRGTLDNGDSGVFLVDSDGVVSAVQLESAILTIDAGELDLNDAGEVVFLERSASVFKIRKGTAGNVITVADTSGAFAALSRLAINGSGQVAFKAVLDVGGESIVQANAAGTVRTTIANTFGRYAAFGAVDIDNAGTLVFTAHTDLGVRELVQVQGGVTSIITDSAVKRLAAKGVPHISEAGIILFQADILDTGGVVVAEGLFSSSLGAVTEIARSGTAMVSGEPVVAQFLQAGINGTEQLTLISLAVDGSIALFAGQPTSPIRDIGADGQADLALDGDPDGLNGPLAPDGEAGGDFLQVFNITDRRARIDLRLADGDRFVDAAGVIGTVAVVGDWLGNGVDAMGIFNRDTGQWSLDLNNNRRLEGREEFVQFGQADDVPVPGDWDPSRPGVELGVFRPSTGQWFLDTNGNRRLDGTETSGITFGAAGDIPLVGNWDPNTPGDELAVFRPSSGQWTVDTNGNRLPDEAPFAFGKAGDVPVAGDWDGVNPADNIGVFDPVTAQWTLDVDGSFSFELSGDFLDVFATGLSNPRAVTFGPDGNLYVGDTLGRVLRFNGSTGSLIDTFVPQGSGGLGAFTTGVQFGPDGNLYVNSFTSNNILRYDGQTGDFIDEFVSAGVAELDGPAAFVFGSDGNLYVTSTNNDSVLRFDGTTGALRDVFVAGQSGGLDNPIGLTFGPDGDLYVASAVTKQVLRYDGVNGTFLDVFVTGGSGGLDSPDSLRFGPDGNLYVSDFTADRVLRYNGNTGEFIDEFAQHATLQQPAGLVFGPDRNLYVAGFASSSNNVVRFAGVGDVASVPFGQAGDTPVVGDWAALGRESIGVYRQTTGQWFLDEDADFIRDSGEGPIAFGQGGDSAITGRWTASNTLIGVFRESTLEWFLDLDGDKVLVAREGPFGLGPSSDTGIKGDQTTNQPTPVFVGQVLDEFPSVTAGTPITIVVDLDSDNTGLLGTADYEIPGIVTDDQGRFVFRIPDEAGKRLSEGIHRVQATFVDFAGQQTVKSRGVRVDLTQPEVILVEVGNFDVTNTPTPADAVLTGAFNRIEVQINDPAVAGVNLGLDPATATLTSNYRLVRSVNGVFGDGDDADVTVAVTNIALRFDPLVSSVSTLTLSLNAAALADDIYRLTLVGSRTITDAAGNAILGNQDLDGDGVFEDGDFITHFSLDTTPPRILSITPDPRAFFEGSYIDPPGDTFGPTPPLDLASLSGGIEATDLVLRVEFYGPIEAPSTGAASLPVDNRVFGFIDLDIDQNPATGVQGHQEALGPAFNDGLGVELFVDLGSEIFHPGLANIVDALTNLVVGTAPISYSGDGFAVSVPLALLSGIEEINLGMVVGVDADLNNALGLGEATDEMLNARTAASVDPVPDLAVPDAAINVGPNVNVSSDPSNNQAETTIAVNPTNPMNIISSSNHLGFGADRVWFSLDGGQTWTLSLIPDLPGESGGGDPTLVFDRSGTAYYAHLSSGGLAVATSTDGGQTWTAADVPTPVGFADKEWLAVGPDVNNPSQDRIYIGYHVGNLQFINSSPDGVNWSPAVQVADAANLGINAQPAIDATGIVYVTWQGIDFNTPGQSNIWFDVSTDGGVTWGTDTIAYTTTVAAFNDPFTGGQYTVPAAPDRGMGAFLSMDVDRSGGPNDGNIYISVLDQSDLDGNPVTSHDDTDVFIIRSTDGGVTWSNPILVNDDFSGTSQFLPWLDVDQTDGTVALVWYDARDDVTNQKTAVYFTASQNGGLTFLPNVRVSEGQSDQSASNVFRSFFNYGEYIGLAIDNNVAHVNWADNSGLLGTSPGLQDVFYATVTFGAAAPTLDLVAVDARLDTGVLTVSADFNSNTPASAPSSTPIPTPDTRLFGFIDLDTNAFTGGLNTATGNSGVDYILDLGSEAAHPGFVDVIDNRGKSPLVVGQAAIAYATEGIQVSVPRLLLAGLNPGEARFQVIAADSLGTETDRLRFAPVLAEGAVSQPDPLGDVFGPVSGTAIDLSGSNVKVFPTMNLIQVTLNAQGQLGAPSSGAARRMFGMIDIDVDRDPTTGAVTGVPGTPGTGGVGIEVTIDLGSEINHPGFVEMIDAPSGNVLALVPAVFATTIGGNSQVQFTISIDDLLGLVAPRGVDFGPDGNLYVVSADTNTVRRYDGTTGAFLGDFASGLSAPRGLAFDQNGNLLVSNIGSDEVLQFDSTGAPLGVFADSTDGLNNPQGLVVGGPDGNVYVTSAINDSVLRFDAATGALIDVFVTPGSGGLNSPADAVFGPDGNLYVSSRSFFNSAVLRYDGTTGAFIDVFASGGGLFFPAEITFGPDANLYVSNSFSDEVLRFDGSSGAPLGVFADVGLDQPDGLVFGPDDNLYVSSTQTDQVLRYDGSNGTFLDVFAGGSGVQITDVDYRVVVGPDSNGNGVLEKTEASDEIANRVVMQSRLTLAELPPDQIVITFTEDLVAPADVGREIQNALRLVRTGGDGVFAQDVFDGTQFVNPEPDVIVPGTASFIATNQMAFDPDGPLVADYYRIELISTPSLAPLSRLQQVMSPAALDRINSSIIRTDDGQGTVTASLPLADLDALVGTTQPPVTAEDFDPKTGPFRFLGGDLLGLIQEFNTFIDEKVTEIQSNRPALERGQALLLVDRSEFGPSNSLIQLDNQARVAVELLFSDQSHLFDPVDLVRLGFSTYSVDIDRTSATGLMPIEQLYKLRQLDPGMVVIPVLDPQLRVGVAGNLADDVMQSDQVRSTFGLDGSNVTIGVISDSVSQVDGGLADSQASGDLPLTVSVLRDAPGFGTDEGRAMLEHIHDIAPGADLLFRTGALGLTDLASAVRELAAAGANIIVDDVAYLFEPFFQDSAAAQAINQVAAQGVLYFSAAGEESDQSYQSAANWTPANLAQNPFDAGMYHDFQPNPAQDVLQRLTLQPGATVTLDLQWDDPFGAALSDVDVLLLDAVSGSLLVGGFTDNIASGTPVEVVEFTNTTGGVLEVDVAISLFAGPEPSLLKYVLFGSQGVSIDEYATGSSTIVGHAAATGAEAVAAASVFDPANPEPFTSHGPTPILFNAQGNRLPSPQFRQTPGITAPDGGNTSFFGADVADDTDVLPNFFGSSAAAANAAGVAALLLHADQTLAPDEVLQFLHDTAVDIVPTGVGFDNVTGEGMIDAFAAIEAVFAGGVEPVVDLAGNPLDGEALGFRTAAGFSTPGDLTDDFQVLFSDGRRLPGLSGDGTPGGTFVAGFAVAAPGNVIFAQADNEDDPLITTDDPDGTARRPFPSLQRALGVVDTDGDGTADPEAGSLAFKRAAGAAGPIIISALESVDQVTPFVAQSQPGGGVAATLEVPEFSMLVFQPGATVKLQNANIEATALGSVIQAAGDPVKPVTFTSFKDDSIGGDTNGDTSNSTPFGGDWGGLFFGRASQDALTSVDFAEIRYGGGPVPLSFGPRTDPIFIQAARPSITNSNISEARSAQAAISADLDSFQEDDLTRGLFVRDVTLVDNSINSIWVRPFSLTGLAQQTDFVPENSTFTFDDPIPVFLDTQLRLGEMFTASDPDRANQGIPIRVPVDQRVNFEPGVVVKFRQLASMQVGGTTTLNIGDRQFLDSFLDPAASQIPSVVGNSRVVFTFALDDAAVTGADLDQDGVVDRVFTAAIDTTNDGAGTQPDVNSAASRGLWGSIQIAAGVRMVIDEAEFRFGGGTSLLPTGNSSVNVLDILGPAPGSTNPPTFASITNNRFVTNLGAGIAIDPDVLRAADPLDPLASGNPFFRGNVLENNDLNGLLIKSNPLADRSPAFNSSVTNNTVWDDTDIVHILRGVVVPHDINDDLSERVSLPGLPKPVGVVMTLQSALPGTPLVNGEVIARPGESLVVKLGNFDPQGNPVGADPTVPVGTVGPEGIWPQMNSGFQVGVDHGGTECPGRDCPLYTEEVATTGDQMSIRGSASSDTTMFMHGNRSELRILGIPSNEVVDSERVPVILTSLRDDETGVFVRGVFQSDTNGDGNTTTATPGDWGGIIIGSNAYTDFDLLNPADGSIIYNADIRFHSRVELQGGGRMPIADLNLDGTIDISDILDPSDQRRTLQDNTTIAMTLDSSIISDSRDVGFWSHAGYRLRAEPVPNPGPFFFPVVQRVTDVVGVPAEAFIVNSIFNNNPVGVRVEGDIDTGGAVCQGSTHFVNCQLFDHMSPHSVLAHNTFFGNVNGVEVLVPGAPTVHAEPLLFNNIISGSTGVGIVNGSSARAQFTLFFGNATNITGPTGLIQNNLFGDPQFVDPANDNFNLREGSAAVDSSISEFGPNLNGDFLKPVFVNGVRTTFGRSGAIFDDELVRMPNSSFVPTSLIDPRLGFNLPTNPNFDTSLPLGVPLFTPLNETDGERDFFGFQRLDAPNRPNIGFGAKPFFDIGAVEFRELGAPVVTNFLLPRDATLNPVALIAIFSEDMNPASIVSAGPAGTFIVIGSGGDGTFTDGNETFVSPSGPITFDPVNNEAQFDLTGQILPDDRYRVIIKGSGFPVATDLDGIRLDGEFDPIAGFPSGDGFPGGDFIFDFAVDRIPPVILSSSLKLDPNTDSNILGDNITNVNLPGVVGTVSDTFPSSIQGLLVELDVDGDGFDDGSALTDINGNFVVTSTTVMPDSEDLDDSDPIKVVVDDQAFTRIHVRVTDQGGNRIVATLDARIDTTPPVVIGADPTAQFPPVVVAGPLDAVDVIFNEDLDPSRFPAGFQLLASNNDGEFVNSSITITPNGAVAFDPATNTVTFPVMNLLNDIYQVTLATGLAVQQSVADLAGNLLDGEFNPATTTPANPSGDGTAAGDFVYLFILADPEAAQFDVLVDRNSTAPNPDGASLLPRVDPATGALVGGAFPTIQAGITAARPGQRVIVLDSALDQDLDGDGQIDRRFPSVYAEQLVMRSAIPVLGDRPGLNVRTDVDGDGDFEVVFGDVDGDGLFGPENTAVQSNAAATVVADSIFVSALSGLTVLNQQPTAAQPVRVGVSVTDAAITISENIIVLNTTGIDVSLGVRPLLASVGAVPVIENNLVWANLDAGVAVTSVADPPVNPVPIFNNTVPFNVGSGIRLDGDKLQLPRGIAFGPDGNLYVSSAGSRTVRRYNGTTGALIGTFVTGLSVPTALIFGPDDNLYVSNTGTDEVLRFDGTTGAALGVFAADAALDNPRDLAFGPDGNLYVSSAQTDRVLRFDGTSGALIDTFTGPSPLDRPTGLLFGPDGDLYVSSGDTDAVLRFDGQTGDFLAVFAQGGGLDAPASLRFGPDGNLYVASAATDNVLRYDATTGAFIDVFASDSLDKPEGVLFGPGLDLFVSSTLTDSVLRFDGDTGELIDTFAGGLGTLANVVNNLFTTNDNADLEVVNGTVVVEFNLFAPDRRSPSVAGDNVQPTNFPLSPTNKFAADPRYVFPLRPRPNDPIVRQQADFRLQANSPAIDAATSDGAPTTDQDGKTRVDIAAVPNTGGGAEPFFDIGAYEFGGALPEPPVDETLKDLAGVYRNGTWFLDLDGLGGSGERTLRFGIAGDKPVVGDFDNDGNVDVGVFRNGTWFFDLDGNGMAGEKAITFGIKGDVPVAGDADGDGRDEAIIYRNGTWFFDTGGDGGAAEKSIFFGVAGDTPLTGDMDGDGTDDAIIYRNGTWFFDTGGDGGAAENSLRFGIAGDKPVVGDWDGDGDDDVGVVRGNRWWLDLDDSGGAAEATFFFGSNTDVPVAGAWRAIVAAANTASAAVASTASTTSLASTSLLSSNPVAGTGDVTAEAGLDGRNGPASSAGVLPVVETAQPTSAGTSQIGSSRETNEVSDEQWDDALLDVSDELRLELGMM